METGKTLHEYMRSVYSGFMGLATVGPLESAERGCHALCVCHLMHSTAAVLEVVLADVYAGVRVIRGSLA